MNTHAEGKNQELKKPIKFQVQLKDKTNGSFQMKYVQCNS